MIEAGQTYTTRGGFQVVITKIGKHFIKAKVLAEGTLSFGVIRYLKEPVESGRYAAFDEGVEYDFNEASSEPEEWGPWVDCTDNYEMMGMTEEIMSEIRFDANSHVMAYRVKKG